MSVNSKTTNGNDLELKQHHRVAGIVHTLEMLLFGNRIAVLGIFAIASVMSRITSVSPSSSFREKSCSKLSVPRSAMWIGAFDRLPLASPPVLLFMTWMWIWKPVAWWDFSKFE